MFSNFLIPIFLTAFFCNSLYSEGDTIKQHVKRNSISKTILTLDFSNAIYELQPRKGGHEKIRFTDFLKMELDLSKSKGSVILPPKPYFSGEENQDWQFGLRITYKFSSSKKILKLSIKDIDEESDGLIYIELQMELSSSGSGKAHGNFWLLGDEGKISNILYRRK